jgi:tRNA (guanine9-N1)-methyltransferase
VYIIGGLVDHNRLKKITYNYALEHKIPMARFPLDKYVDLKSNCHLAVNHVYDIILRVYNGQGWEQAIKEAIPQRKIMEAEEKPK